MTYEAHRAYGAIVGWSDCLMCGRLSEYASQSEFWRVAEGVEDDDYSSLWCFDLSDDEWLDLEQG